MSTVGRSVGSRQVRENKKPPILRIDGFIVSYLALTKINLRPQLRD